MRRFLASIGLFASLMPQAMLAVNVGNYDGPFYHTGNGFWYVDPYGERHYTTYDRFGNEERRYEPTRFDAETRNVILSVSDSVDPVRPGDAITYSINVRNDAQSTANVDIVAYLDPQTDFRSASNDGQRLGDRVVWQSFIVYGHTSRTVEVTARVDTTVDARDSLLFRAMAGPEAATQATKIVDHRVNEPRTTTTSERYPDRDLEARLDASVDGSTVHYKLTVANNTPQTYRDTDVVQQFSVPVERIRILSTDGGRDSGDRIAWDLGNLQPYEYRIIQFDVAFQNLSSVRAGVEVTVRDPALRATAGASVRLGGSTSYQYNYDAIVMPQTGAMSDFFTPLERSSVTMRTSDASSQRPLLLIVVVPLISALGIAAMKKRA